MSAKRAVIIGTNYDGASYQLSGCVNDAVDWNTLLADEGYECSTWLGPIATRANIVGTLQRVVSEARWGDRIVVTYSGHGTWLPDRSGDEVDGRDEAWCPDDMQTAGLITDDDLAGIFSRARSGVGILVLSDSCFSGTITRLVDADNTRRSVRFLPPWVARGRATPEGLEADAAVLEQAVPATPRTYTDHASLISGCAEPEVSYDAWFGNRANGAMTRAAIDTYRTGMSLAAWHRAIHTLLPSDEYPQTPMLSTASVYRRYARAL